MTARGWCNRTTMAASAAKCTAVTQRGMSSHRLCGMRMSRRLRRPEKTRVRRAAFTTTAMAAFHPKEENMCHRPHPHAGAHMMTGGAAK